MWGVGFFLSFSPSTIWKNACMYMYIIHWSAWHLRGSGGRSQVGTVSDTKDMWDFVDRAAGWIAVLMDERVHIRTAVSERVRDCGLRLQLQPVWWCNTGCSPAKSLEEYSWTKKKVIKCRKLNKVYTNALFNIRTTVLLSAAYTNRPKGAVTLARFQPNFASKKKSIIYCQ